MDRETYSRREPRFRGLLAAVSLLALPVTLGLAGCDNPDLNERLASLDDQLKDTQKDYAAAKERTAQLQIEAEKSEGKRVHPRHEFASPFQGTPRPSKRVDQPPRRGRTDEQGA